MRIRRFSLVALFFLLTAGACGRDRAKALHFKIAVDPSSIVLVENHPTALQITLDRAQGYYGPLSVGIPGLPEGVSADPLEIALGATAGTLVLHADAASEEAVLRSVQIVGTPPTSAAASTPFDFTVHGASGALDRSFGSDGVVLTDYGVENDQWHALQLLSDGRILVAGRATNAGDGDFALARFLPNGDLDSSFAGGAGKTQTELGSFEEALAMAIAADGKIVLAGYSQSGGFDLAIARYLPDGTLDTNYGIAGAGYARTDVGALNLVDIGYALVLQSNGRAVVAGRSARATAGNDDFVLARYDNTGALDPAFGTGGIASVDFATFSDQAFALSAQADGKLIASGCSNRTAAGSINDELALVRFSSDGVLDTTYGALNTGSSETPFSLRQDRIFATTILPDGKLLAAGTVNNNGNASGLGDFFLARYDSDGVLDPAFGGGTGIATLDIATNTDSATAFAFQPDGKIVVVGRSTNISNLDLAVARFDADGNLDHTFGQNGKITLDIANGNDEALAVAVQPDGRILIAGYATVIRQNLVQNDALLVRIWP